jgi:anti-sigma regulatory factor (Ser/Thr protein kinase)
LAARSTAARTARSRVRVWLEAADWPAPLIDDITCAVNEAVTNAIEHAYRSSTPICTVTVALRVEHAFDGARRVRIRVVDRGRWRLVSIKKFRGRGLVLIHGLMAEVLIRPGDGEGQGTLVDMLSHPTPGPGR